MKERMKPGVIITRAEPLKKDFYDAGVEEELLREMCAACRQNGIAIPVREMARCVYEAFEACGLRTYAMAAIGMLIMEGSDWQPEKVLILLKMYNITGEEDIREIERFCARSLKPTLELPDEAD